MANWDPQLLDQLEALPSAPWNGTAWRHMFNDYPPERVNTGGARWNPRGVGAIYTALDAETALAEGQHAVDVQRRRLFAKRVLYEVEIQAEDVVDLTGEGLLNTLGLTIEQLASDDFTACQQVGGALAWLGRGGLVVPSARNDGSNLVILVTAEHEPEVIVISDKVVEVGPRGAM